MKTTVNLNDFRDSFQRMNRKDNFTYKGLEALYDYLTEMEDSYDTELELDVIALCCEFTEYENLAEFHGEYNKEDYETIEDIEDNTMVIKIDEDSFIIQDF